MTATTRSSSTPSEAAPEARTRWRARPETTRCAAGKATTCWPAGRAGTGWKGTRARTACSAAGMRTRSSAGRARTCWTAGPGTTVYGNGDDVIELNLPKGSTGAGLSFRAEAGGTLITGGNIEVLVQGPDAAGLTLSDVEIV